VANDYVFTKWVSMKALDDLVNMLEVADGMNTDQNKEFDKEFAVGETIQVKLPQAWTVTDGLGYQPQSVARKSVNVTVNQPFGIHFEWDSFEKALRMERSQAEIHDQYIEPAVRQLAQEIDSRAALFAYQNTNNIVGVLGTDPTTTTVFAQARQKLIEKACPAGGQRKMVITPNIHTSIDPAFLAYFNPTSEISKLFKEGSIGRHQGFDWYESMSLYAHTAGTWAGAVTMTNSGSPQSGASITVVCTTGDTFMAGDVFSIANVNAVNPKTRRKIASGVQTFVILANATGVASAATLLISPAIVGPGDQYQNVDALPALNAALTLFPGTAAPSGKVGTNNLAFHRNAFALVGVKLELPKAVEMSSQTRDPKTGLAIRFTRTWDAQTSSMKNRWDIAIGFGALRPDACSVRVLGL
jgi:hypothetical protein